MFRHWPGSQRSSSNWTRKSVDRSKFCVLSRFRVQVNLYIYFVNPILHVAVLQFKTIHIIKNTHLKDELNLYYKGIIGLILLFE